MAIKGRWKKKKESEEVKKAAEEILPEQEVSPAEEEFVDSDEITRLIIIIKNTDDGMKMDYKLRGNVEKEENIRHLIYSLEVVKSELSLAGNAQLHKQEQ